jgi:hypothetical protein
MADQFPARGVSCPSRGSPIGSPRCAGEETPPAHPPVAAQRAHTHTEDEFDYGDAFVGNGDAGRPAAAAAGGLRGAVGVDDAGARVRHSGWWWWWCEGGGGCSASQAILRPWRAQSTVFRNQPYDEAVELSDDGMEGSIDTHAVSQSVGSPAGRPGGWGGGGGGGGPPPPPPPPRAGRQLARLRACMTLSQTCAPSDRCPPG